MKWKFTKSNLQLDAAGNWRLRKRVAGRDIDRCLWTTKKREAVRLAEEICTKVLSGNVSYLDKLAQRREAPATVGDILDTYEASTRVDVRSSTKNGYLLALVQMIAEVHDIKVELDGGYVPTGKGQKGVKKGTGKKRRKMSTSTMGGSKATRKRRELVGKLPAKVISWELVDKFKELRVKRPPKLFSWEARLPDEMSQPGKLTPADLNRVKRTCVGTVKKARAIFAKHLMHPERGIYRHIKLPDTIDNFVGEPLFKVNKRKYTMPKAEELQRLFDGLVDLRATNPEVWKAWQIGWACGLRLGEIRWLRWDNLEQRRGNWFFNLTESHTHAGTKGKEDRKVKLPEWLARDLKDMKTDGRYIVAGSDTWRRHNLGKEISAFMRGQGWKRMQTTHELRKHLGAQIATQTGNLYQVMKILGQKDYKTILETYEALADYPEYVVEMPAGCAVVG